MKIMFVALSTLLLLANIQAQTNANVTNVVKTEVIKKGLTMQATVWPSY
jgi:hypothetical protein